ncbi:MAG: RpiB/LacA/LacB family sugar-phosphate isomerase [Metamycoplasmataceae bacterium]
MKFILSGDHGGYELKEKIKDYLESKNFVIEDLGCSCETESVSYAEYGKKLALEVLKEKDTVGIGVCGTGIGISIAVNRFKGIRGARITSVEDAKFAKIHNNANILLFGGRQQSIDQVIEMIKIFVENEFEGGRHIPRIEELDK